MKKTLCVAVGVLVEFPDDTIGVRAPLPRSPLDELAAWLRREACCGRDCSEPRFTRPSVSAHVAAACRECSD
jgi:hypothetical protein